MNYITVEGYSRNLFACTHKEKKLIVENVLSLIIKI